LEAVNNPEDPAMGTRRVPFGRALYIEREDFREDPPKKFYRLAPGREVRLRYGYIIKCVGVTKDPASGEVTELRCTYDPASLETEASRGGGADRRVKATIHWASAAHSREAEVRLYDTLFAKADPGDVVEGEDWKGGLREGSVEVLKQCRIEPGLAEAEPGSHHQFERLGYFCVDTVDSRPGRPVFNRTVTLRDRWANIEKAGSGGRPQEKSQ
jgi:glutaminyl-tRNA synthetase